MLSKISDGFNNPAKPLCSQSWHPSDDVASSREAKQTKMENDRMKTFRNFLLQKGTTQIILDPLF